MLSTLYLLRHGKTELAGRYAGATDIALSKTGRKQIEEVAPRLSHIDFDHIVCSPMLRCRESLELLNLPHDVIVDDNLREIDFGEWEGKSFQEISKSSPDLVEQWSAGGNEFCFPGGECIQDFILRLEKAKSKLLSCEKEKVLVIAHGGVIRYLLCSFLGISYESYLLFRILEGTYVSMDIYENGGVLTGLNRGGSA